MKKKQKLPQECRLFKKTQDLDHREIYQATNNKANFIVGVIFMGMSVGMALLTLYLEDIGLIGIFVFLAFSSLIFFVSLYLLYGREFLIFDFSNKTIIQIKKLFFVQQTRTFCFDHCQKILVSKEMDLENIAYYTYLVADVKQQIASHQMPATALEYANFIAKKIGCKVRDQTKDQTKEE